MLLFTFFHAIQKQKGKNPHHLFLRTLQDDEMKPWTKSHSGSAHPSGLPVTERLDLNLSYTVSLAPPIVTPWHALRHTCEKETGKPRDTYCISSSMRLLKRGKWAKQTDVSGHSAQLIIPEPSSIRSYAPRLYKMTCREELSVCGVKWSSAGNEQITVPPRWYCSVLCTGRGGLGRHHFHSALHTRKRALSLTHNSQKRSCFPLPACHSPKLFHVL